MKKTPAKKAPAENTAQKTPAKQATKKAVVKKAAQKAPAKGIAKKAAVKKASAKKASKKAVKKAVKKSGRKVVITLRDLRRAAPYEMGDVFFVAKKLPLGIYFQELVKICPWALNPCLCSSVISTRLPLNPNAGRISFSP